MREELPKTHDTQTVFLVRNEINTSVLNIYSTSCKSRSKKFIL